MAVYDAANHEANAKNLAETIKILENQKKELEETLKIREVMGIAQAAQGGVTAFSGGIMSQLSAMQCLFPDLSGWGVPRAITPNFGSVCSARRFVDELLTVGDESIGDGQGQQRTRPPEINRERVLQQRQMVLREAALNGLALAYQQKHETPQSAQRIASAAADAANSTTIHGDLQAVNKLLVVIAEQMVAQRMLLAALLENSAGVNLQNVPVSFFGPSPAPLSQPNGGSYQFGE